MTTLKLNPKEILLTSTESKPFEVKKICIHSLSSEVVGSRLSVAFEILSEIELPKRCSLFVSIFLNQRLTEVILLHMDHSVYVCLVDLMKLYSWVEVVTVCLLMWMYSLTWNFVLIFRPMQPTVLKKMTFRNKSIILNQCPVWLGLQLWRTVAGHCQAFQFFSSYNIGRFVDFKTLVRRIVQILTFLANEYLWRTSFFPKVLQFRKILTEKNEETLISSNPWSFLATIQALMRVSAINFCDEG